MKSNSQNKFSLADARLYPHFKLTRERFPRLLATRKIDDDAAEYFGAFLPETRVRFLIDFLNKTFRLRTCEIEIDGSFDVPCTQFYRRRCVAPCVASLCSESEYAAQVELVRSFLGRGQNELEKLFLEKIEFFAEALDFERAAAWRDAWTDVARVLSSKDWNFRLDDAVDTFEIGAENENFLVYLVTMRGRKTLGKRVFSFAKTGAKDEILPQLIPQFYRFHAPKEIRVPLDFPERAEIAENLSRKFGRPIRISVARAKEPKITTERALDRARYEHEFRRIRRAASCGEIESELQRIFVLPDGARRLEGFDVAHISGSDFVAARSVWENGKFLAREYEFWFSAEKSELETLRKFIARRFAREAAELPSLVLIDGGRAHLQAALKGLKEAENRKIAVVSAVKPSGRHAEISHFLTEAGARIDFDGASAAHRLLQTLRDEAHDLSNEIHRQRREMAHFYELAALLPSLGEAERRELLQKYGSLTKISQLAENDLMRNFPGQKGRLIARDLENHRRGAARKIEPLIVPLRYTDENGDAQDLRPLADYRAK